MRAAGSGRRHLTGTIGKSLRELLARMLTRNSIRGDGLRRRNEYGLRAPCWSEIAHGNDVRTGQRADTGEVTVMTANAGND